jgi:hypothetical protein
MTTKDIKDKGIEKVRYSISEWEPVGNSVCRYCGGEQTTTDGDCVHKAGLRNMGFNMMSANGTAMIEFPYYKLTPKDI